MMINTDAYSPPEIARRVEALGVTKARADTLTVLVLAMLAGAFISLGAIFSIVVTTEADVGFGVGRLLAGLAFSLGLVLVIIGGAELFTGNNLVAMAWASRRVSTGGMLRNWVLAYVGNVVGAVGTVVLVYVANTDDLSGGAVGDSASRIGEVKSELDLAEMFVRGILANALVCMAVWLAMGARSISSKVLAIIFPVTAFVAMGFEHSIANWFFLPYAIVLDGFESGHLITRSVVNLVVVTAGNIIGGSLLVALVYGLAYLRNDDHSPVEK